MEAMLQQGKMQSGAMEQMQNNPEMMTQAMEEVCVHSPARVSRDRLLVVRVVRRSARHSSLFSPCTLCG